MLNIKIHKDKKVLEVDGEVRLFEFILAVSTGINNWKEYTLSTNKAPKTNTISVKYDTKNRFNAHHPTSMGCDWTRTIS